ncbi:MAG TPA: MBL fold metallo-hydrolase [Saprospiraceae bacterium]|nr:MBL fold metallo-hydrolase [Saprospiraceae bacterium]
MRIKFCGAAGTVTGSAHLVILQTGEKILLDCGLFQGVGKETWDLNNHWHFDPREINYLVLSHAHIDHTGRVPQLVKDGFKGKIISTHATRSLSAIMLMDSAYIQERDVDYYNTRLIKKRTKDKWDKLRHPLYVAEDVNQTMTLFVSINYDTWFDILPGVRILYKDSGHILGSASVNLEIKENGAVKRVAFSGDIGRPHRPILRDPQQMLPADILITESTYGDKVHEAGPAEYERFLTIIKNTCLMKGGKLIIPAFSIGRTQELVYLLDRLESSGRLPRIPVYVDSPLAVDATEVFRNHPECFDDELNRYLQVDPNPFGWKSLHYVRSVDESKALNTSKEPSIIISSSGMIEFGRVRHHLYNNIEDKRNSFLIVGYCTPESPGGQLKNGARALKIFGDWKDVRADIYVMDSFSAHGDRLEMCDVLSNQKTTAREIFLVHGEPDRQAIYKDFLESEGFKGISLPKLGEVVDL